MLDETKKDAMGYLVYEMFGYSGDSSDYDDSDESYDEKQLIPEHI